MISLQLQKSTRIRLAPFFLFCSAFFWSLCGVLVKSCSWNALSIAICRGILSCLIYCCILRQMPKLNKTKIIVAVCYFMQSMLIILANRYTSAGCATALQNTSPIYIICLSALYLKHKPLKREIVTCACMLLGICLTLVGSIGSGFWGNILALISAFFYAGVFFFSNRPDANPFESLVLGNGLFVLLLPVLLADPHVQAGQPSNWLIVLACSLLSGTVAWLFFAYSIRYVSALQANFITMTEPIMSPLWTYLFLREKMSATAVAGCVIVIVTLLIYNRLNRPHPVRVPKKDEAVSLTK